MAPPADTRDVRRNGLLSSCEPCRMSKLRCDHHKPVCARCLRTGKQALCSYHPALCSYHPAPMTGARPSSPRRYLHRPRRHAQYHDRSIQRNSGVSGSGESRAKGTDVARGTGIASMAISSLLSPFSEEHTRSGSGSETTLSLTGIIPSRQSSRPTARLIEEGAEVLQLIHSLVPRFPLEMGRWPSGVGAASCNRPVLQATWVAVSTALRAMNPEESFGALSRLAEGVFEATSSPLELPVPLNQASLTAAISGSNLRWETVGICCSSMGMFLSAEQGEDGTDGDADKTSAMVRRLLSACISCRRFCESASQINDLTVWFLISATQFATWSRGDDSCLAWQLMGELCSSISALGITAPRSGPPCYSNELRKRAVAASFELDKVISTFVSRPPRMSRRYWALDLPLDLPDEALLGTEPVFAERLLELDYKGWNTAGVVYPASRLRAAAMIGQLRDAVLELSFEVAPSARFSRIQLSMMVMLVLTLFRELLRLSFQISNDLPSFLQYTDPPAHAALSPTMLQLLNIRLDHLYTDFLLYKTLVQHHSSHHDSILQTSHKILQTVLSALNRRDVAPGLMVDLEWIAICYAMPCATSLVLALLRQLQTPQQSLPVHRSVITHDLAVFISCCDWLSRADRGNQLLCKQAQGVLSRSLEFVLAHHGGPTSMSKAAVAPTNETMGVRNTEAHDWDPKSFLEDDPEIEAWMSSFGFVLDPWFDGSGTAQH